MRKKGGAADSKFHDEMDNDDSDISESNEEKGPSAAQLLKQQQERKRKELEAKLKAEAEEDNYSSENEQSVASTKNVFKENAMIKTGQF